VIVDFDSEVPGGSLDRMAMAAWERAAALDMPADGRIEAYDRAVVRGATWQAATKWLRNVFCGHGTDGLFRPGQGIATYALGARPKAGDYSWDWWPQWSGPLHYRALVLADDDLAGACDRYDDAFADYARQFEYHDRSIALGVSVLPSLWWACGPGRGGTLAGVMEKSARRALAASVAENGRARAMDSGAQAVTAEGFMLAEQAFGDAAFAEQAMLLLKEINAKLDGPFWEFNCGQTGNLMHGGQIRPLGHGHAALANVLAHRLTGRAEFMDAARRFARYLVAINYVTHDASPDPDFDWRGWANGSNAGRDQIAEFPPWETIASLLCLAPLMEDVPDSESGFYDVLWYIARTGLAQFPAARELKRVHDETMHLHYLMRNTLASERDFYDILPFLAYENPHDQTLLASYQGTDCLLGELVFGGGLAQADDGRLGLIVPGAAVMDARECDSRLVLVWNPTAKAIRAAVAALWPAGAGGMKPSEQQKITVEPRRAVRLEFAR
jgi:hypothetical protein